jgi:uncharacterized membrane protein
MEFLNIYLLGGLALLGVPVVLHLIMRQKPRRLPFPAFRFLRQRHIINRRRMRLQHLLLLLLRMLVLAALCFAIAQPKLFLPGAWASWFGLNGPRPAAAVFVFDVSHSMEYRVGGLSRLDDARQRALDLLHELPPDSQIAVFDTSDDAAGEEGADDWIPTPAQVRSRINGLRFRPVRAPLTGQIEKAADLLAKAGSNGEPSSRRLYVFSDRTTASWDADAAKRIKVPEGVQTVFIDLGVDQPANLGIEKIEVAPLVAPPGGTVTVPADLRAIGSDFEANLLCQLDDETSPPQRVHLSAGSDRKVFVLRAPTPVRPPGLGDAVVMEPHKVVVKFATLDDRPFKDDLPHDNIRFATFQVRDDPKRQGRRVLTLADDEKAARIWRAALEAYAISHPDTGFHCDLRMAADAAKLGAKELKPYHLVCLFQNVKPLPPKFWTDLAEYVRDGGGLVIVPPGEELTADQIARWNADAETAQLLPARLQAIADAKDHTPVNWAEFSKSHPLTRPFYEWIHQNVDFASTELRPSVNRFWQVQPTENAQVVAAFADEAKSPALIERRLGQGNVIQFTTTLDARGVPQKQEWHNYWVFGQTFGLVLVNEVCKYLAGEAPVGDFNFRCGEPVVLTLPPGAPRGAYRLDAPDADLSESERSLTVGEGELNLEVRAASAPGQYTLFDSNRNRSLAFSLNVDPTESRLDRLPLKEIEAVLGPGSVVAPDASGSLNEALKGRTETVAAAPPPPALVDLLPLLMVLTLLFLTCEGLLANRFYERPSSAAAGEVVPGRAT